MRTPFNLHCDILISTEPPCFSEALSIDPHNRSTNAKLYFNRATVAAKLKNQKEAITNCDRALDLDPNYTKALLR